MDASEGEQASKVPPKIELPEWKPTERELERQKQSEERREEVRKDPRSTGQMLEEIRRKMMERQGKKP